jgi:hypothetical protein
MGIAPSCSGACEVLLTYDGGTEMRLAKLSSAAVFIAWIVWAMWKRRAMKAAPQV